MSIVVIGAKGGGMDPVVVASGVMQFLVQRISRAAGALADRTADEAGDRLYELIKEKLTSTEFGSTLLTRFEGSPGDARGRREMRVALEDVLEQDRRFKQQIEDAAQSAGIELGKTGGSIGDQANVLLTGGMRRSNLALGSISIDRSRRTIRIPIGLGVLAMVLLLIGGGFAGVGAYKFLRQDETQPGALPEGAPFRQALPGARAVGPAQPKDIRRTIDLAKTDEFGNRTEAHVELTVAFDEPTTAARCPIELQQGTLIRPFTLTVVNANPVTSPSKIGMGLPIFDFGSTISEATVYAQPSAEEAAIFESNCQKDILRFPGLDIPNSRQKKVIHGIIVGVPSGMIAHAGLKVHASLVPASLEEHEGNNNGHVFEDLTIEP